MDGLPVRRTKVKVGKKSVRSAILDQEYIAGSKMSGYSRKQILEYFHENSDHNGVAMVTQKQAAEALGIDRHWLCNIVKDLASVGYLETSGRGNHSRMVVLHHPDDCDWGPEWQSIDFELRKRRNIRNVLKTTEGDIGE